MKMRGYLQVGEGLSEEGEALKCKVTCKFVRGWARKGKAEKVRLVSASLRVLRFPWARSTRAISPASVKDLQQESVRVSSFGRFAVILLEKVSNNKDFPAFKNSEENSNFLNKVLFGFNS